MPAKLTLKSIVFLSTPPGVDAASGTAASNIFSDDVVGIGVLTDTFRLAFAGASEFGC